MIEETIRRNASPTRLEGPGSCSSLASSASDENVARTNRNSIVNPNPNASTPNTGTVKNRNISSSPGQTLLHSLSTNDATVGEYKYTVCIGSASIKITGDCFELVRVAKLVLDDYFSSNDFLASVDVGATLDNNALMQSPQIGPLPSFGSPFIPSSSHQLNSSSSPFGDSGINLDLLLSQNTSIAEMSNAAELDDEVFIVNSGKLLFKIFIPSIFMQAFCFFFQLTIPITIHHRALPMLLLSTDWHVHAEVIFLERIVPQKQEKKIKMRIHVSLLETPTQLFYMFIISVRIVHEYERLLSYAKSPHSWSFPLDWKRITEKYPQLVKNKVKNSQDMRSAFSSKNTLVNNSFDASYTNDFDNNNFKNDKTVTRSMSFNE